ncbi:MAG: HAD hydrolase-like protein [Akkermansiaceae bacterium]|nr:HAD hydrolase-like protein [Akkermansiaceae bacterium]
MLYLFDIDGTLVDTGGAGMCALEETGCRIFGGSGPPLDLAGSTDLGIVASMHEHFGVTPAPATVAAFFEVYHQRLEWNLANGGFPGRVLPGVVTVLKALALKTGAALGLLTGNTATGAAAKMRHFNLAHFFPVGAYGCDHADRNRLGPIALDRARTHFGRGFSASETLIIGDTPKDIACARAIGARCLAVATGRFSRAELEQHGADHAVTRLDEAIDWLGI